MSENKKAVATNKVVPCAETTKVAVCPEGAKAPVAGGRASGFSPKAVKLYKASKMRFLALQKKK